MLILPMYFTHDMLTVFNKCNARIQFIQLVFHTSLLCLTNVQHIYPSIVQVEVLVVHIITIILVQKWNSSDSL